MPKVVTAIVPPKEARCKDTVHVTEHGIMNPCGLCRTSRIIKARADFILNPRCDKCSRDSPRLQTIVSRKMKYIIKVINGHAMVLPVQPKANEAFLGMRSPVNLHMQGTQKL